MSLRGWYAYAFAAEPFVVSAVATYVPLLLAELGNENAVWVGDLRTPCRSIGDQPGLSPLPIAPPKCVVKLGSVWIDTTSLPLYTFSVSVLVQMVVVISISGLADRGAHRKSLLVGFAILGALGTIVMGAIGHSHYYVAALLAIFANASFGAVSVCGNAYLPTLVSDKCTEIIRLRITASDRFHNAFPRIGRQENVLTSEEKARISARISGTGTAIGYGSALFVQITTMLILVVHHSANKVESESRLQLVIALIGWWWLLGQIPVALWLKSTAKEEELDNELEVEDRASLLSQLSYGWISLVQTIVQARKLRDIVTFLMAWFLLSDAVTTINSTAVLFARTNLQMAAPALALIGLITVLFAISGSLVFGRRKKQKNSLVIISLLGSLIPLYGILGFLQPWIGLKHAWEIYLLAAWYGTALGALNAVTRSLYALLIPEGREVMFFALYSVTDKGSSVIGPSVTGLITDHTHNIRYTFYFLLGMMLLAAFLFAQVDFDRGQLEAVAIVNADLLDSTPPDLIDIDDSNE